MSGCALFTVVLSMRSVIGQVQPFNNSAPFNLKAAYRPGVIQAGGAEHFDKNARGATQELTL